MQVPANETELIRRAQRGDKEAISALYQAYVQSIFLFISYRVMSQSVAEDLTADVFLRMVRSLPQYKQTGTPFGAWLYRIATNRVTDFHRQRHTTEAQPLNEQYESRESDMFEHLVEAEEHDALRSALANLSEDYQTVLLLRFTQDLTHAEVASIMDKSAEAVRVLQHRALKALSAQVRAMDKPSLRERGNS